MIPHQIAAVLYGLTALGGMYWWMRIRWVLPMERTALKAKSAAQGLADFAKQLLNSHRLPADPQLMADILKQSAERLAAWEPELSLAIWRKDKSSVELVYTSASLETPNPESLKISGNLWSEVFSDSKGSVALDSFAGLSDVHLFPWGRAESLHGVILARHRSVNGESFDQVRQMVEVLAGHFTAVSDMAASLWDIDRKRQRLEGGLSALHEVAATITAHQERPGDMLSAVVSIVARAIEADLCAFLLYDERSGELVTQAGAFGLSGDEGALYRVPVTNGKSSSVRVFLTGVPFITGDAQNDPRVLSQYAKSWRCNSVVVVPLSLEDKRIGVMRVGNFKNDYFTPDHIQVLQLIAEEAVVLIESALVTRKLTEANQKLSEINQLKDEFVSTASHEFKTPLTSVKGFISVLLDGDAGPLTDEQRRFLLIARSAADRLTALVTDLLDLSRLEAGVLMEFGPVNLAKLCEECRHDYEPQANDRSVKLQISLPSNLPQVRGDAKWLRQAIDNLVSNALKFTPSGGTVAITASDKGDMLRITVSDTGVGIGPEDQKRIFEKFYRANNRDITNPPGTGLGLAIVKFIMDKHEGKIWVESELGKGSNFHFILPVIKGTGEANPAAREGASAKNIA